MYRSRDFLYLALPLFSVQHWKAKNEPGDTSHLSVCMLVLDKTVLAATTTHCDCTGTSSSSSSSSSLLTTRVVDGSGMTKGAARISSTVHQGDTNDLDEVVGSCLDRDATIVSTLAWRPRWSRKVERKRSVMNWISEEAASLGTPEQWVLRVSRIISNSQW